MNPLVVKYEGCILVCYADSVGVPTIGYGHTKGLKRADIGKKHITKLEATNLLEDDLKYFEGIIIKRFGYMPYKRMTALTSFIFNLGEGALDGKSTKISTHVKNKDWQNVAAGMLYFNKAGGKVSNGLVNRRCEEASWIVQG